LKAAITKLPDIGLEFKPPTARRAFSRTHSKENMSTKIDFATYLTSTLTAASTKLKSQSPPNNAKASRLDTIVRSAENISVGYWAKIEPLYEPFSPKLQLAVRDLNTAIIAGQNVQNFDAYISTLVANLAD
jgi:hypothetical protein